MIEIQENLIVSDTDGRKIRIFTPVFKPNICAMGELRFACFTAWNDEPDTFQQTKDLALFNAVKVIKSFAENL